MGWAKLGSTNDLVRMEIWQSWVRLKIWLGLEIHLYRDLVGLHWRFVLSWRFHWVLHLVALKIWFCLAGKVWAFGWAVLDW